MNQKAREAVDRLNKYLDETISPEQMAANLRYASVVIHQLMNDGDIVTQDVKDATYYLNDLAEQIDPYFTKHIKDPSLV